MWSLPIDYLDLKVLFDEDEVAKKKMIEGEPKGKRKGKGNKSGGRSGKRKDGNHKSAGSDDADAVHSSGGGGGGGAAGGSSTRPRAIYGYHPHGIIPFTAGLVLLSDTWRKRHGKKPPIYMTDAFVHTMPIFRDIIQWLGCREVHRDVRRSPPTVSLCTRTQLWGVRKEGGGRGGVAAL